MKILFLGDIVGRPGRAVIKKILPGVIAQKKPDLVIANAENMAGGKGVNRKTVLEMMAAGIDCFTGGNHTFAILPDALELFKKDDLPVLRPANFPPGTPGQGWRIITSKKGSRLLVISVLGRIFMPQHVDCPFRTVEHILQTVAKDSYDACLIDFHAEATSEKQALRWAFDGQVTAVIGTHTHIPTADAEISPAGTSFQADAGMNGSLDSCIGVDKDIIIRKLKTLMPVTHVLVDTGRMQFNGVFVEIDPRGKAKKIQHIRHVFTS